MFHKIQLGISKFSVVSNISCIEDKEVTENWHDRSGCAKQ
jgi:hypothetical protein